MQFAETRDEANTDHKDTPEINVVALAIGYFTWIQHLCIWGSIAFWYLFLFVYGSTISTTAYKVLAEACGPSPMSWFITLLVVISILIPYSTYTFFERRFFPLYHSLISMSKA